MAIINAITQWIIPVFIAFILITGYIRRVKLYETFVSGAKEGLEIILKITPVFIAMFIAIGIIRQSGALSALTECLVKFKIWNAPAEIIGLMLLRPLSGSGSLALVADILKTQGPDSFAGILASTLQGTTETTLYVLTVYFGAVGITRMRHCLAMGLLADLMSFISAFVFCKLFFG